MTRRKPFLTYFGLCAIPLLLLAGLSYWNGVRTVDSTAAPIVQNDLNAFNVAIDAEMRERKSDFLRLSMMRDVQYVVSDKERIDVIPQGFFLTLKMLPLLREFESVTIFNRDRHAFVFRRGEGEWTTLENYHGAEFTEPDPHVWETQGNVTLERLGNGGKTLEYSAPIHDEKGTSIIGGLIGILDLDDMFARAARGLETRSVQLMVMAVDQSGKIVYHSNRSLKDLQVTQAMPGFSAVANDMLAVDSGLGAFKSPTGSYLIAYSPVPQLNVSVAVAREQSEALSMAHRWGIAGLVLALLFAAGAAFFLAQHVEKKSKGIEQVSADVSAIAKGELDRRILLESSDDFRSLADNINVVTDKLRAQIAREEETRQFESFMRISAMLTHDLKNAIEGLSLTVGNMERHFDNPQFRTDAMKGLTNATDKLKAIVARLSRPLTSLSGEHKRPKDIDLVPILKRVSAMTAEPMRNKHSIVLRLPESVFALADAARIEEVIENLVLNGLEAMVEPGGTLTIEAGYTVSGAPSFSISDTGPGMSRIFIENRLFRPFATTKKSGIGLGLYTCREVVRASGGTIDVHSVEGAGTTFRVVLPSATQRQA